MNVINTKTRIKMVKACFFSSAKEIILILSFLFYSSIINNLPRSIMPPSKCCMNTKNLVRESYEVLSGGCFTLTTIMKVLLD